ncbi:hypothetical protein EXIGLDRAFT_831716 [Exidia glandulosa HHB12029]|uniref:Uncharacterized protein n=1 Tax=Exidia glandulosa HHB12029 TaxID=1314781 RepID=A0A165MEN6_EXIGL|nr:hypothetical protein EXIGLDRAFT_831716 [Exidia glandulosa HHB12029]
MVAISSSFVLLAILASATAAPAAVKRDPIVDVDFLSNDPSEASVLDVDVGTTHQHRRRRPALSSRLFGKRQHDDDDALVDVDLLGDYHDDDRTAHRPYLADIDILRRAPQTTGDVLSGPDSDDSVSGPGISRLRRAGFLAARRARKHKGSKTHHPVVDAFAPARDAPTSSSESPAPSETAALLDVEVQLRSFDDDEDALLNVDILGGHHHYVDSMPAPAPVVSPAAASPSPSPSPSSMASTPSSPSPASSSSSSSPKSTSSSSSSGIVYDPSAIKENATSSKKTGHKSVKASSPVKSNVKPKIHASVGRPSSTPASATPSPSTEEAPAPSPTSSAVPGSAYHTHDDALLDVAVSLKRRDERRPTSLDPLAVSSFADDKPRPRCVAPPTVTGVNE